MTNLAPFQFVFSTRGQIINFSAHIETVSLVQQAHFQATSKYLYTSYGYFNDATREILPTFCKINPLTIYFI
ncbi:hypothetical protein QG073_09810, partial [Kingella kingae]|uniref:hypothetical protein n=1 Tax=Kingella kingae TaxID=504 RepID=UPI00254D0F65